VSFRGKRHRGFGFVEYKDEKSAAAALKDMAGKEVEKDKAINVQYARVRPEKPPKAPKEPKAKKPKAEPAPKIDPKDLPLSTTGLFIGGLPKTYTTEDLTKDFTKFGELADAFVSFRGKRHRGFGFVEYKDEKSAAAALKDMAGKEVEKDKAINVQYARVRPEKPPKAPKEPKPAPAKAAPAKAKKAPREPKPRRVVDENAPLSETMVFVGGLPKTYTTEDLVKDFSKFGELTDAFVSYRGKRHRGFGFVDYKEAKASKAALAEMAGKEVAGSKEGKPISVTQAREKPSKE